MENITYKMARFTRELSYADLSPEAIALAKRFLLDSIGCAFGGSKTEDVEILMESHRQLKSNWELVYEERPRYRQTWGESDGGRPSVMYLYHYRGEEQ